MAQHVLCTYVYAAPELFFTAAGQEMDYAKADAYSLGVILHELIYGERLYDEFLHTSESDVRDLHASGLLTLDPPPPCPEGIPWDLHDAMLALLQPDPLKRPSVTEMYLRYPRQTYIVTDPPMCIRDPPSRRHWGSLASRREAIRLVRQLWRGKGSSGAGSFALAVSLADRLTYAMRRPCSPHELGLCVDLASCICSCNDVDLYYSEEMAAQLVEILSILKCNLFSDTCDTWIRKDGYLQVRESVMYNALIKGSGNTGVAVDCYRRSLRRRADD